jgi:uncharacterized membrane protein
VRKGIIWQKENVVDFSAILCLLLKIGVFYSQRYDIIAAVNILKGMWIESWNDYMLTFNSTKFIFQIYILYNTILYMYTQLTVIQRKGLYNYCSIFMYLFMHPWVKKLDK